MKRFKVVFLLALVTAVTSLKAQNLEQYWFFGDANKKGMQFSKPKFKATLINRPLITPYGMGGGAVASDDITGELLFYTDGSKVYNRNHVVIGTSLSGNPAGNQAAVICKNPAVPSQYYIFTNAANGLTTGAIQYSIVDMSAGAGVTFPTPLPKEGAVTSTNQTIPGLPNMAEAMTIVTQANGTDYWLITHDANGQFFVTSITQLGGITAGVGVPLGLINRPSNFAFRRGANLLAVSPREASKNIEIYQFDNATGTLTPSQTVNASSLVSISPATQQGIYDTEWSKDGRYLYASVVGNPPAYQADVLQFDLDSLLLNPALLPTTILTIPETESYGLQMAPDSSIYHLYKAGGVFKVARIKDTDSVASKVIYQPVVYGSVPDFKAMQFPSFVPRNKLIITPTFEAIGLCANSPTSFFPTVTPGADSLKWDFGDGSPRVKGWSPTHTYTTGNTYKVILTAYLNGDSVQTPLPGQDVIIKDFKIQISLTSDTTACSDELPFPKGWKTNGTAGCTKCFQLTAQVSGGSATQKWFGPPGDLNNTTTTLKPDSAGFYYIVATDGTGCSAYAGVTITEYGVQDTKANIWHFGTKAGIDFNPLFAIPSGPAKAIQGPLDTPEGCAVICDANGQIILSTDGQNIFDRTKTDITPTPNPPGLGGDPGSTQSALIVPVPNDPTLYYIFTTQDIENGSGTFELRYSLFDLKGDATHPNGVILEYNKLLFSKSTERITSNGTWLIAHEFGNDNFRAYPIAGNGIGNPVISNIGSVHSFAAYGYGQGYMKFGPGGILAVPIPAANKIEIFNFNNTTGEVLPYKGQDPIIPSGTIYGLEFYGSKMFVTLTGNPSQLLEYFIKKNGDFQQVTTPPIPPSTVELGEIQIGPDQQLYVAVNGADHLGVIQPNGDSTKTSTLDYQNGFKLLAGTTSNLGLPNFIQQTGSATGGPSLTVTGLCLGDSTFFTGTGTSNIDTLYYLFDDGTSEVRTSGDKKPVFKIYKTPGQHSVVLKIRNRCAGDVPVPISVSPKKFIINAPPANPSGTFVLCKASLILDANPPNAPNLGYLWNTLDTLETITVRRTGIFSVTVTDTLTGCKVDGNLVVTPGTTPIDIAGGSSVCAVAGTGVSLTTGINLPDHTWTKNGVNLVNNTQSQFVDFTTAGTYKYKVVFTNPNNHCIASDSATFVVNQPPAFLATPTNGTNCSTPNGRIDAIVNGSSMAGDSYSYLVTPSAATGSLTKGASKMLINTLTSGSYTVTVTDVTNNCPTSQVVSLGGAGTPTVTPSQVGTCDPLKIMFNSSSANGTYRIIDNTSGADVETGAYLSVPKTSTNDILKGTYVVEVTAAGCKGSSSPISITPGISPAVSFVSDICATSTLSANILPTAATTYTWTDVDAGTSLGTSPSVVLTSRPKPYNLKVVVGGGACPATGTTTVTVDNFTAAFTHNTCTTPIHLKATPVGSTYLYNWTLNGVSIPGASEINATTAGSYMVSIQSFNGCPAVDSAPETIDPDQLSALTVSLDNVFPCSGQPFDLNAVTNRPVTSYTWKRNTTTLATTTNPLTGNTQLGTYSVTVIDPNDATCIGTTSVAIAKYREPTPGALKASYFICPEGGDNKILNPDPEGKIDFESYSWTIDGGAIVGTDSIYEATKAGTYKVVLLNSEFCPSESQTIVTEECDPDLNAPKAFKPSSAVTENTDFYVFPHYVDTQGFQMFIYNRWGEMVYSTSDLAFKWNGTFNNVGQMLPPGTYSWVAKFKSKFRPQDGIKTKHGGVVLLR